MARENYGNAVIEMAKRLRKHHYGLFMKGSTIPTSRCPACGRPTLIRAEKRTKNLIFKVSVCAGWCCANKCNYHTHDCERKIKGK